MVAHRTHGECTDPEHRLMTGGRMVSECIHVGDASICKFWPGRYYYDYPYGALVEGGNLCYLIPRSWSWDELETALREGRLADYCERKNQPAPPAAPE